MENQNCGPQAHQAPSALIFCAGIGTTSVAIKRCGYKIIGAIDKWDYAEHIYKLNFSETLFVLASLRGLTAKKLRRMLNREVDFLQISNPCTGVSTSGKREMFAAVNELFFVATKLAFELRPKVILYENVVGLTNKGARQLFGMVINFIKRYSHEYNMDARLLNAHLYGDPQARVRIFIQCVRKDVGYPVWPEHIDENQRRVIGDVIPSAEYIANRDFGHRIYHAHEPAPTVTGSNTLTLFDGEKERLLTPRELASLMGLPDDFILEGSREDQVMGIGNGVCVGVMEALARTIKNNLLNQ